MSEDEVKKVLCELFHVERLAAFVPMGKSGVGTCFWFRIPNWEGIKIARLDELDNLHLYEMEAKITRYPDGEVFGYWQAPVSQVICKVG